MTGFGVAPSVGTPLAVGVGVGMVTQSKGDSKSLSVPDRLKALTQRYEKIRVLLRVVTESVNIGTSLAKNLQDGLVRITRNLKVNRRGRSSKVNDRSNSSRTNNRNQDSETNDESKNTKTYKRDNSIQGVD